MERYLLLNSKIIQTQLYPWWIGKEVKEEQSWTSNLFRMEEETDKDGYRKMRGEDLLWKQSGKWKRKRVDLGGKKMLQLTHLTK